MAYITEQELFDKYTKSHIADLAGTDESGEPDSTVVAAAIADASAEIDAYVNRNYDLAQAASSKILKAICYDLTRYELVKRTNVAIIQEEDSAVYKIYKDRMRQLERIASGQMELDIESLEPEGTAVVAKVTADPLRFGRGKSGRFN